MLHIPTQNPTFLTENEDPQELNRQFLNPSYTLPHNTKQTSYNPITPTPTLHLLQEMITQGA